MVDQPEYGTKQPYLIDFIKLTLNPKLINPYEIRQLFLEKGLSSVQIARKLNVSKSTILSILHRLDVRVETQAGRINNPENCCVRNPPYGYRIQDGRLVLNKSEIRVCRLVVELVARRRFTWSATARELAAKGYKNRNKNTKWDHSTVRNIFERWKNKLYGLEVFYEGTDWRSYIDRWTLWWNKSNSGHTWLNKKICTGKSGAKSAAASEIIKINPRNLIKDT